MTELAIDNSVTQWAAGSQRVSEPHALTALASGQPLLILMHGLGSHEGDLIQLAPYLPDTFVCASLRAPLAAYEPHDGYSWFPLSLQPGTAEPTVCAAAARAAADSVLTWLTALQVKLESVGANKAQVAVMGFSQGGVMVTTMLRLASAQIFAAVNCSGFVAPGNFPEDEVLTAERPTLFWGRDSADPIISQQAMAVTAEWAAAHTTLTAHEYPGIAHSISRAELADINDYLTAQLAASGFNNLQ